MNMNKLIQFTYQISDINYLLVEIQGSISHTAEPKYYFMFLGKLTELSKV